MDPSRQRFGLVLGLLGMVLFAATLPAMKLAIPPITPWFFTVARGALAGVVSLALLLAARRPLPPRASLAPLAVAGLCLVFGFPIGSALAMQQVPAAHGAVVLGILPLATALAAAAFAGERPSRGFWLAGLAGAALVIAFVLHRDRAAGGDGFAVGDLALLGAVIAAAVGYTFAGKLSATMPGWECMCWVLALMLPLTLPATMALWPADAAAFPAVAWSGFLFNTLGTQLLGFFLWNAAMARAGIARIGQLQLLQPFVVIGLAAAVNGERIDAETLLFAAAVVAVVMLGQRTRVRR